MIRQGTRKQFAITVIFLAVLLSFAIAGEANANSDDLTIQFFYSPTCPHCIAEQSFLDDVENKYPQMEVKRYLAARTDNQALLRTIAARYDGAEQYLGLVPLTFIGEDFFVGFNDRIGEQMILSIESQIGEPQEPKPGEDGENVIKVPFLGSLDENKYSLPALSVILGTLDGVNVCSLGALVLILSIVLALRSRKKIILYGGAFIVTTAVVYGILIVLWHQLFLAFSQYTQVMQVLVGLLGVTGGVYFLREFLRFRKYGMTCEVAGGRLVVAASDKVRMALEKRTGVFAVAAAVVLFAITVTILEFPCSAVIPLAFAGILASANLSPAVYFFYIALFILFYMLDEIIVFLIAVFTMRLWMTSHGFVKWATLVAGVLLFVIGIFYISGAFGLNVF